MYMNNAKKFSALIAALVAAFLGACSSLTNLTPEKVPENASRTYTLSMSAYINDGSVVKDSIKPYIVIDEKIIPMREVKDFKEERIYEYDYVMPKGRKDAKYYFLVTYEVENNVDGVNKERKISSRTVYTLEPQRRYVVDLQNERGPVGTSISILGRGFDKLDKVIVGGVETATEYVSRSNLNFVVPPLESGRNYDVEIQGTKGRLWVGQIRVDTADMAVSPEVLEMDGGDIANMIFNIGFTAPEGGYPIDVKTNIPSSVIMDEVVVPAGRSSVSVPIKAAAEGKGFLYVNGLGFREKTIPVTVKASDSRGEVMGEINAMLDESQDKAKAEKTTAPKTNSDKNVKNKTEGEAQKDKQKTQAAK